MIFDYSLAGAVSLGLLFYLTENCCGRPSAGCTPVCVPETHAQPAKRVKRST